MKLLFEDVWHRSDGAKNWGWWYDCGSLKLFVRITFQSGAYSHHLDMILAVLGPSFRWERLLEKTEEHSANQPSEEEILAKRDLLLERAVMLIDGA